MFKKICVVLFLVALSVGSYFAYTSSNAGEVEAGKPLRGDTSVIHHNYPPIVEQQSNPTHCYDPDIWWDLSRCVTNDGSTDKGCGDIDNPDPYDEVFDPDDRQEVSSLDGHVQTCLFADWAGHSYFVILTGHKKNDFWVDVTTDKALDLVHHQDGVTGWSFSGTTGEMRGPTKYLRGCFHIELSRDQFNNNQWQEIPYQGGGGDVLGYAVPVTLTFKFPVGMALGIDKRAIERCP